MIKGKNVLVFPSQTHSDPHLKICPFGAITSPSFLAFHVIVKEWSDCTNLDMDLPEATERRTAALEKPSSPSQLPTAVLTLEAMTSYRRIEEAFHCKLKGPVVVEKKTLVELQNFQTVCFEERVNVYELVWLRSQVNG